MSTTWGPAHSVACPHCGVVLDTTDGYIPPEEGSTFDCHSCAGPISVETVELIANVNLKAVVRNAASVS